MQIWSERAKIDAEIAMIRNEVNVYHQFISGISVAADGGNSGNTDTLTSYKSFGIVATIISHHFYSLSRSLPIHFNKQFPYKIITAPHRTDDDHWISTSFQ